MGIIWINTQAERDITVTGQAWEREGAREDRRGELEKVPGGRGGVSLGRGELEKVPGGRGPCGRLGGVVPIPQRKKLKLRVE